MTITRTAFIKYFIFQILIKFKLYIKTVKNQLGNKLIFLFKMKLFSMFPAFPEQKTSPIFADKTRIVFSQTRILLMPIQWRKLIKLILMNKLSIYYICS
ncbi:hypothetical protein AY608_09020 [Acinetobacter terrae]|nr:hypothetical protein AY608_09020 [Acinetobacter terrae]